MKKKKDSKREKINKRKKSHLNYCFKLLILIFITCLFLVIGMFFLKKSILVINSQNYSYTEKSNIDYQVFLKENDFYESEYLEKNMSYIASLIDYINVSFDYEYVIDKSIDATINYKIVANLNINNDDNSSNYYSKEYTLLENKKEVINNSTTANIHERIKIDYDYYNKLANKFKQTYGVNTNSNLVVYLKIDRNVINNPEVQDKLDGNNNMLINIPLSQKALSIKLDYNEIDNQNTILSKGGFEIANILDFCIGVIALLFALFFVYKIFNKLLLLFDTPSNYDKYLKRILKEYDRLIVITQTMPDLNHYQVFNINNFTELLDVRDNTKKPIMYFNVVDHFKSYFYIKDESDIYLFVLKATDIKK